MCMGCYELVGFLSFVASMFPQTRAWLTMHFGKRRG